MITMAYSLVHFPLHTGIRHHDRAKLEELIEVLMQ